MVLAEERHYGCTIINCEGRLPLDIATEVASLTNGDIDHSNDLGFTLVVGRQRKGVRKLVQKVLSLLGSRSLDVKDAIEYMRREYCIMMHAQEVELMD